MESRFAAVGHAVEQGRQPCEGPPAVLATEQLAQNRLVVLGRGVERHNRQRQHLLGHRDPPLGGQRRIGQDRGCAGGSVDQRTALCGLQLEPSRQLGEQRVRDQNFPGPP